MRPIRHTWQQVDGELREGKTCSICKQWLPLAAYGVCSSTHDKLQLACMSCLIEYQARRHESDPERRKRTNKQTVARYGPEYYREKHLALKKLVMDAYGGKCACCGETELVFLSLDHIHGGGAEHRRKVGASKVWRDLRDVGFPQGDYRVLCMNCQYGWQHGRICPHELQRRKEAGG
jgi:hypothetical protein